MHLHELLSKRATPGAGLFMMVTTRCPLSCAHCSTDSSLDNPLEDTTNLERVAASFTPSSRPDVVLLTGGEPLLRPALVGRVCGSAQAAGSSVALISGMFFARDGRLPPAILRAVQGLDHFTASLDRYHEAEIDRSAVFDALDTIRGLGVAVSVQACGLGDDDPYLADLAQVVRARFDDAVPIAVAPVQDIGRATTNLTIRRRGVPAAAVAPCALAAWPVVTPDGSVNACCNQAAVGGRRPRHLDLGSAPTTWAEIDERVRGDAILRTIRTWGPKYMAAAVGGPTSTESACATCHRLGGDTAIRRYAEQRCESETMPLVESLVERSADFTRHLVPAYADLVTLGRES